MSMDSGRSIQHEISSLKGTPLTFFCFGSSDCNHHHAQPPLFSHNPCVAQGSFSWMQHKQKLYFGRFLADEPNGGFRILGSFTFLQSFADKRNEKLLFSVLCRREQGFDRGARGNNCAETVYLMSVSACEKDCAGGRMRQGECVLQCWDLLVPCPSVRTGTGAGRLAWHNRCFFLIPPSFSFMNTDLEIQREF